MKLAVTRRGVQGTIVAGALLGMVGWAGGAAAQYPERPINVIVAWAAGGATDVVTRALQPVLAEQLGGDLVIRNVAGAAGTIGTAEAAAAPPDGYTLLVTPTGPLTTQPHLRELPYDIDSFDAIGRINITPMVMMATKDSPFQTIEDIIEQAKAEPNSVVFASTGAGTLPHISILALNEAAGIETRHVPFQGSANVMQAMLGGTVHLFSDQAQLVPQYELHAVAVWADERLPEFPDTPTVKESGFDFVLANWLGVFVPAGTPDDVKTVLADALQATLEDPGIVDQLNRMNLQISHMGPDELTEFALGEYARNRELLASAGLVEE